ncbi:hypothetical protein AB0M43_09495 [Longispora sp. NPDC051575]|uniref:hypothetical protein n=1 Tax=Longispora sp. NPDC051575 TaxID=3154943 RepID=UPI0034254C2F
MAEPSDTAYVNEDTMVGTTLRRGLAALAATALGAGILSGAATPAAAHPRCWVDYRLSHAGGVVTGYAWLECGELSGARDALIERRDPVTGGWATVAEVDGWGSYACAGDAPNTYRLHGIVRTFPCG